MGAKEEYDLAATDYGKAMDELARAHRTVQRTARRMADAARAMAAQDSDELRHGEKPFRQTTTIGNLTADSVEFGNVGRGRSTDISTMVTNGIVKRCTTCGGNEGFRYTNGREFHTGTVPGGAYTCGAEQ